MKFALPEQFLTYNCQKKFLEIQLFLQLRPDLHIIYNFRGALDQAMSNTYIRDGFNLVLTNSQKDSMRFLCRMTETMKAIYRSKNLKLVTDRQTLNDQNLLSYQDFYNFSRPNKPLTARHTFCNMLICQSGLSPGMA